MNPVITRMLRAAFGTLSVFGNMATLAFAQAAWRDYWHQVATIGEYRCVFVSCGLVLAGGTTCILTAWWWMLNNAAVNEDRCQV